MTSSSISNQAVSNGTDTLTDAKPAEREHGINRVQEELVYHVAGLAEAALYEAERLMYAVKNGAMKRTADHDGSKGTQPVDLAQVATVIAEALDCIDVAAEHLSRLSSDIRSRQDDQVVLI